MGEQLRWILLVIGGVAILGYYLWTVWLKRAPTKRDPEFDDIELTVSADDPPEEDVFDELSGLSQLVAEDAPAKERLAAARKPIKQTELAASGGAPEQAVTADVKNDHVTIQEESDESPADSPQAEKPPVEEPMQEGYTPIKVVDDEPRPEPELSEEVVQEPEPEAVATADPEPEPIPEQPDSKKSQPSKKQRSKPAKSAEPAVEQAVDKVPPSQFDDSQEQEPEPTASATAKPIAVDSGDEDHIQNDLFGPDNGAISQPVDGLYEWNGSEEDLQSMRASRDDEHVEAPSVQQTGPTEEQVDDFFSMDEPEFAADPKPVVGGKRRGWQFWRKKEKEPEEEPAHDQVPELILVLYVVAKPATVFLGTAIQDALHSADTELGTMNIYHRIPHGGDPNKPVFSIADMLEPGTLENERMKDHTTPGLTFFMRLPGPIDGQAGFEDMISAAVQVSEYLGGELRDERRSVLTKQTIDHMRERIMEHRRQAQLALSKAR